MESSLEQKSFIGLQNTGPVVRVNIESRDIL